MLPVVYLSVESPCFVGDATEVAEACPSYHDSTPRNPGIITPREYTEILVLPQMKMYEPRRISVVTCCAKLQANMTHAYRGIK